MRQGGLLAWLLCGKGGVFGGEAVDHQGIASGLGGLPGRKGEKKQ